MFGEAKPRNTAIIVYAPEKQSEINATIELINQQLPDYAQVHQWIAAETPFTPNNQQLTDNGRLKREVIWQTYKTNINALYEG